jgi:hypothetical protein
MFYTVGTQVTGWGVDERFCTPVVSCFKRNKKAYSFYAVRHLWMSDKR